MGKVTMMMMAALLASLGQSGCQGQIPISRIGNCRPGAGGNDCTNANGDGVHIARTTPESAAGLRGGDAPSWLLLGFRTEAGRVFASAASASGRRESAPITVAAYRGRPVTLRSVSAEGADVRFELLDREGVSLSLAGAALDGLLLTLAFPDDSGNGALTEYDLRLAPAGLLGGNVQNRRAIPGYAVEFREARAPEAAWRSYCTGVHDEPLAAAFFPGSQWDPQDGRRTDAPELIALTCETGAVATCALWGYVPWERAARSGVAETESLADYHQACIHLKRAAYCGTAASYTSPGMQIEIGDPLGIRRASVDVLEALWTPQGAVCISSARDPESGFLGCPEPLPACTASHVPAGAYLISGLPHVLRGGERPRIGGRQ